MRKTRISRKNGGGVVFLKMMTNSVRAIPFPIKRLCWRSSPHGRALQTLSISRTMALVALALTVPDFWQ